MLDPAPRPLRLRSRQRIYQNPWTVLLEDRLIGHDGRDQLYGYFARKDFVIICPLHVDRRITLVRQWRHAYDRSSWELPCGACDEDTPPAAARRELAEETGLCAARWRPLGAWHHSDARVAGQGHVFLAEGLQTMPQPPVADHSEADLVSATVPLDEALSACDDGRISNVMSVAVLYRVARALTDQ